MFDQDQSTVSALCYEEKSNVDFPQLAAELAQALRDNPRLDCRVSSQYEDFVIFDLNGLRICLAHCDLDVERVVDQRPTMFRECLVVSVGNTPGMQAQGPLYEVRGDICQGLIDRIQARHPSNKDLKIDLDLAFTESVYDDVLNQIWPLLSDEGDDLDAASADEDFDADFLADDDSFVPDGSYDEPEFRHTDHAIKFKAQHTPEDLFDDLEARFEQEMASRDAALREHLADDDNADTRVLRSVRKIRPTHPAAHADKVGKAASNFDEPPAPWALHGPEERETELVSRLRYALYPPDEEMPDQIHIKPLTHRAAIYTINATVIAISLPVGAAVMTYCILGRESLNVAARTMALTGTAIGFSQLEFASSFLSVFV